MDYVRENSLVTQRRYTYDALARPETRDTRYPNKSISHNDSFAYNHRSELTGALLDNSAYTYAYDNIGNREIAQEASKGITYAANELNQYTRISTDGEDFMPEYDADGNQTLVQTSTGIWTTSYNAQNRAVKFESADGSTIITCAYDYMGRCFEKQVSCNGLITTHQLFIYRNYLQIAAVNLKEDASTPDLWYLIWDPTQPIATRPLAIRKDGIWYTYGWDLTKNICEIYGQQGYIRTIYRYSPYGTVTAEGDVSQPIQWSGEMFDSTLGLSCYLYRYYNHLTGSWISRDSVGESDAYRAYTFLHNDPNSNFDLYGLLSISISTSGEFTLFATPTPVPGLGVIVKAKIDAQAYTCCNQQTGNSELWGELKIRVDGGLQFGGAFKNKVRAKNSRNKYRDSRTGRYTTGPKQGGGFKNPKIGKEEKKLCPSQSGCSGQAGVELQAKLGFIIGVEYRGTWQLYPEYNYDYNLQRTSITGTEASLMVYGIVTCDLSANGVIDLF